MKKLYLLFTFSLIYSLSYGQQKNIDSLTKNMDVKHGIINTFIKNDKLLIEINRNRLGCFRF